MGEDDEEEIAANVQMWIQLTPASLSGNVNLTTTSRSLLGLIYNNPHPHPRLAIQVRCVLL